MTDRKQPLVLGVGGLLEQEENGRIQDLLGNLQKAGCVIYSVRFTTICRDGNTIVCPFSEEWVNNFNTAAETALNDSRVDRTKVGIIASSIGAAIADCAIAQSPVLAEGLGPYAAISPFARPHENAIKEINYFISKNMDLDVSFPHDRIRGIKRVIPHANLARILSIDSPKELKQRSRAYRIVPLTILGLKDDRCDIEASRERHNILEGTSQDLREYDEGHNVSAEATEQPILEFMYRELNLCN